MTVGTVVGIVPCDFPPCDGAPPPDAHELKKLAADAGRGSYQHQSWVSTERGTPTLLEALSPTRALPFQPGSAHVVFSCRAAGGGLAGTSFFWYEAQRLLKPNGLLFIENQHARQPIKIPPPHRFCMEQLSEMDAPWFVATASDSHGLVHHNYLGTLRCFRRLPLAACKALKAGQAAPVCRHGQQRGAGVEECLTPDGEPARASAQTASPEPYGRAAFERLVDGMAAWLSLTKLEMRRLAAEDERHARASVLPPTRAVVALRRYPQPAANVRVVTVLVVGMPDRAFARVLRSRATQFWGIAASGVRVMSVASGAQSVAPPGTIVHDLCSRPLPVHPRSFDVIVLHDASELMAACARAWSGRARRGRSGSGRGAESAIEDLRRQGGERGGGDEDAPLRHLLLELKRLSRPGRLGLVALTGTRESLERSAREHLTTEETASALWARLNVSWLGCLPQMSSLTACAARVGVSRGR